MKKEEIKNEFSELVEKRNKINDRIEELQNLCKHEDTFIGDYSWRIGTTNSAEICEICNVLIKYL